MASGIILKISAATAISAAALLMAVRPEFAPSGAYGFDKIVHIAGFAAMGGSGLWFLPKKSVFFGFTFLFLCILGGGMEIAQSFIPGREASLGDFLADVAGAALGMTAVSAYWIRMRSAGMPSAVTSS